ncbi:diphthine synthase [Babesia microti strain RI]|uniref:diphthine methyl ester synthase n=1 Tax=Babesia microti (strain RI) TaxID=1133968 RepID=A0A0K3ATF1_BABMR|nr:diphthine synthase [Babesia microti strain RI]CTQ40841.1 diphthine synthase [Babesia microti strain RI]|eukprot:XP_012648852.1 diphthine synthase [Babesia microti strain RI]
MVLYIIGLGLTGTDISLNGLEILKNCKHIYLESYTSILMDSDTNQLESLIGKTVIIVDRYFVEMKFESILQDSILNNIALLIVGDVFAATTHTDLYLRGIKQGIPIKIVHNISIINAISVTGLQLYRFGQIVSIPFFEESWKPTSFVDKIIENIKINCHTLCLLDIKVKEQTLENLMKGNKTYEPPRYMTINTAIKQLLELTNTDVLGDNTLAIGVARLGSKTQKIVSGTLKELESIDFGAPLHSLVICAPKLHDLESEFFQLYRDVNCDINF